MEREFCVTTFPLTMDGAASRLLLLLFYMPFRLTVTAFRASPPTSSLSRPHLASHAVFACVGTDSVQTNYPYWYPFGKFTDEEAEERFRFTLSWDDETA